MARLGLSVVSTFSFGFLLRMGSALETLCGQAYTAGQLDLLGVYEQRMNLNGWEAMLFIGLNAAISVRVSNELGSGRPRAAKHAVAAVVAQSLAMGLVGMTLVLAYRNSFMVLFHGEAGHAAAVGKVAPSLAATMVLNGVRPVISGGIHRRRFAVLVTYINLGCYYAGAVRLNR
ncbi:unnamed protein product [Miscanthus lutarioriparius]|uniref:Uncharacterized protein n=1 Tax=Miscanthus lutarioriparius TaxID=422564 RepID=A0A811MU30_9POAL|nr:unnamed protein product [Miscanthus lutarioriparius]